MSQLHETAKLPATETISTYHWLLFFICFFSNMLGGAASTLMSVYLPVVAKDLLGNVDNSKFNEVSAFINALYFIGWATGGLVWGMIGDKIGRAKSLATAVSMYGCFTILKGFAPSWELMIIFQFFCGFGVGGVLVMNTTLLSESWPASTRSVFIGFVSIGFPVGIFSSGAINYFVSSWRQGFMFGFIPLALGLTSFFVLRESERWKNSTQHTDVNKVKLRDHQMDLFNGSIIFGSMLIGLWAIFSWLPTWAQSLMVNSDGQKERGLSLMLLGAGGLSGGFLSGWISNALGMRKTMVMCFTGCFILSFLLFKLNSTFSTITILEIASLSFMFGISQGMLSVYVPLLFPVAIRGTATGFCFNLGRFFTAAAVFFVGAWVVALGGYGNSLFAFSFVFFIGLIFLLIHISNS
jgi:MFS family permease